MGQPPPSGTDIASKHCSEPPRFTVSYTGAHNCPPSHGNSASHSEQKLAGNKPPVSTTNAQISSPVQPSSLSLITPVEPSVQAAYPAVKSKAHVPDSQSLSVKHSEQLEPTIGTE
ncbi:MAG: hypothetical protein JKY37_11260 [Nannocystaceae bacterium]|nr:hypothetical protein [Nannocystaceae bacterium]